MDLPGARTGETRATSSLGRFLVLGAVVAGLLPAFGCAIDLSIEDLDAFHRALEVRTVVVEKDFSILSAFPPEETLPYVDIVREELEGVSGVFGARPPAPVIGRFVGMDGITPIVERDDRSVSGQWLGGTAGNGSFIIYLVKEVTLDGSQGERVRVQLGDQYYRLLIRHEIAHLCEEALGVTGKLWLSEGIAEEVESMTWRGGRLTPTPRPDNLQRVAGLAPEGIKLERALDLKQDSRLIARGLEKIDTDARALAHALFRYFLSRYEGLEFSDVIRRLDGLTREEILQVEPDFRLWLRTLSG